MRRLCNHLFGENHSSHHRLCTGFIIMLLGVLISEYCSSSNHVLSIAGNTIGYGIHAFGATPFIERLMRIT